MFRITAISMIVLATSAFAGCGGHRSTQPAYLFSPRILSVDQRGSAFLSASRPQRDGQYHQALIKIGADGEVFGETELSLGRSPAPVEVLEVDNAGYVVTFGRLTAPASSTAVPSESRLTNKVIDLALCKYDPSGGLIWSASWGAINGGVYTDLAADGDGSILASGRLSPSGTPAAVSPECMPHCRDHPCEFLTRFDTSGACLWSFVWQLEMSAVEIATDDNSDAYVVGYIGGEVQPDGNPFGEVPTPPEGSSNAFLFKVGHDGNPEWIDVIGSRDQPGQAYAGNVDAGPSDELYVAGHYRGAVDFNLSPDEPEETVSSLDERQFLCKYTQDGTLEWARTWYRPGGYILDLAAVRDGGVLCTGYFYGLLAFAEHPELPESRSQGGSADAFLAKFDSDGECLWIRTWGGPERDIALRIATDETGNSWVLGWCHGPADLAPGEATDIRRGGLRVFLSKFDTEGRLLWAWTEDQLPPS
jgi:hypothetical protein